MLSRLVRSALVASIACLTAAAQDARRFETDFGEPLAKAFAAYFEARGSATGLDAAQALLVKRLAELQKEGDGRHPLRRAADVGWAVWRSRELPDERRRAGKVTKESFAGGIFSDAGLQYVYRLPDAYDPTKATYPLIVAIPDHEEDPQKHVLEDWADPTVRERAVLVSPAMPADLAAWPRVSVNGRPGGLCHVLTVLRVATERFAIDFDRVYVVGMGKGVPTAVAAGNYGPQLFAGVVGRAGDVEPVATMGPANFSNLPTLFTGAGANARAFRDAARAQGYDNSTLLQTGGEEEIWSWMREHPRRTYPESVTVAPGDPFPTRAYWLRIAPTAPDARATATLEREANAVRIVGHGVSRATLYLNDELLDLDRPVRVVVNEVESTRRIERHVPTMLDLLVDGTSDPACVYTAELVVDASGDPAAAQPKPSLAEDAALLERLSAAGTDVDALWRLHLELAGAGRAEEDRAVLRRIVRLDPEQAEARAALGHVRGPAQWFTSAEAFERFRRRQDDEAAEARGAVKQDGLWMSPDERLLAGKGLKKDEESGMWLGVAERRKLEKGWVLQDDAWIPPEEAPNVDLGLWKVDGEWVDLESANRRHARPETPWRIPDAEVSVLSTADRAVALRAQAEMRRALDELRRVFALEPALPLEVLVLRDEEQYDRFAFGAPDGRRAPAQANRVYVVHSAFFAESWFEREEGRLVFRGMGVCYWDPLIPYGDSYGRHSARLALGLSYVEALDPSPKAVRRALAAGGPGPGYLADYRAEKRLPPWLRWGGAVYGERFFEDATVPAGGDPWWARTWSIENIRSRGGWRGIEQVLAFPLEPDRRVDAQKLLIEAGLAVSFLVDGACPPVDEAHAQLERRMLAGKVGKPEISALEEALLAHEAELRAYAGL